MAAVLTMVSNLSESLRIVAVSAGWFEHEALELVRFL